MRVKIKKVILLLLVMVMSFSVFACADIDSDDRSDSQKHSSKADKNDVNKNSSSPDSTYGTAAKPSSTPDGYVPNISGTIKLTYSNVLYSSDANRQSLRRWINDFTSYYPDVKIIEDPTDPTMYSNRIGAKDMGDVFGFADTSVYDYTIAAKALMPLDSYAEVLNVNMDNVYAGFKALGTVEGKLYFVATDCGQHTFTYNKDAIKSAGLEMPENDWTWDDFKHYVKELTIQNPDGTLKQVGAAMDVWNSPMYVPFFEGFGGKWCDTVNKRITLTDDEKVMEGMGELIEVLEKQWVYPNKGTAQVVVPKGPYDTAFSAVSADPTRSAVFTQLDSFKSLYFTGMSYINAGIDWDVVAFPLFDSPATPCGSNGYGVFKYTKNPDTAAAFCLSVYSERGQMALNSGAGGAVPLLSSLSGTTTWRLTESGFESDKINYKAFTANTEQYIPSQVVCSVPQSVGKIISDGMVKLFNDFYSGGTSWRDNLTTIQTQANQEWMKLLG